MVKTLQTCKKSTGSTAPRIVLKLPSSTLEAPPSPALMEVCDPFRHNEFCIVCQDGSVKEDCLFLCNACPRVMCSHCIDIPSGTVHQLEADDITFLCIYCHVGKEQHGCGGYSPYFGFYQNDKPLFPSFLPIRTTLEVSLHSQLSSAPVLMLHLILIDHDTTSGSFELTADFLRPYFPSGGLEFHTIAFDIGNDTKIMKYQLDAACTIQSLLKSTWTHVVIAITNHMDNDEGDLFMGYETKKKTYVSVCVHTVLDILLSPWDPLIHGAAESYLWLLSYGALINKPTSFACLQAAVINHHMTATIGFNTIRFQPTFTTHLLLAFAELILIERFAIQVAFPDMLGQSYKLGCHSDMFLMMLNSSGSLTITQYAWTHTELCPWGQYLPVQCPQCGWINAWRSVNVGKVYHFECKNDACRKGYSFSQPANSRVLLPGIVTADSPQALKRIVKKIHKAILEAQKELEDEDVPQLPTSLKKEIKQYCSQIIAYKEEAEVREAASHPREASFYKKSLTKWDVTQRLFKEEIDKFDKAEQRRKGVQQSIKYQTGHAREWFDNMSPSQQEEVKFTMTKWNREGAPEESQAVKNNLKKTLEDFSEQIWCTMGCQVVMFVSHKKKASQIMSVSLHETKPQNVKKRFSVSSNGIKEWTATGFESFAEWSKTEFCNMYPTAFVVKDPSHMKTEEVNHLWNHWEQNSAANKKLVIFVKAKDGDVCANMKKTDWLPSLNSSDFTEHRTQPANTTPDDVSFNDQYTFLESLSKNDNYLELIDATRDLAKLAKQKPTSEQNPDLPIWANWSWGGSYLPEDVHVSYDTLKASLDKLLGLLYRESKSVIEYEEDEADPNTPFYLPGSAFNLEFLVSLDQVVKHIEKLTKEALGEDGNEVTKEEVVFTKEKEKEKQQEQEQEQEEQEE
ncbi:uncharacterized protein BJ212DRAFT_1485013 [Suillus subaureus]|uniref:Uncharacterized protein n=1 Tax=Suillus subaureus TaxID=48587 RepID=A0A9P7E0X7_9AGAM|nr:uncharacterized protein BJ212DRAFT_1485013 [Suillus subaureus]KAG1808383.1 hypothetical protein BJ212DRAFT_1485013 [Suillus subaureus]